MQTRRRKTEQLLSFDLSPAPFLPLVVSKCNGFLFIEILVPYYEQPHERLDFLRDILIEHNMTSNKAEGGRRRGFI